MAKVDPKQLTRYNVAMGRFAPPCTNPLRGMGTNFCDVGLP